MSYIPNHCRPLTDVSTHISEIFAGFDTTGTCPELGHQLLILLEYGILFLIHFIWFYAPVNISRICIPWSP
jgi:hypothetical protein